MRPVVGLVEKIVFVADKEKKFTARIDTGATVSSIDHHLVEQLQLEAIRSQKTIRSAHGIQTRPMIRATIILKNKMITGLFTVARRSHMTYPVLIGQNILKKGEFMVDPLK
ncbi:MAG TPA: RimK/LysX family protein [Candidatus Nanoarchaeia archaeon]|nr:RimK/LysX family protein [Candidatus Nanoarchaeia archaeon]